MSARLVLIGRIAGAFGVKGAVRITAYGADPGALLKYGVLKNKDGGDVLTLISGRVVKGDLIASAAELCVKEAADALRGLELYVPRAVLPSPEEEEFYLTDLVGLRAETLAGHVLGRIKAVPNFGAGDILEIQPADGPAFYLPFTRQVVPVIQIDEGRVVVELPTEIE